MDHLIIGAGPAGVTAAEHLARLDPSGTVSLLVGEPGPPYARMAIPYLLGREIDEAGTFIREEPSHYEDLGIRAIEGRAASIRAGRSPTRAKSFAPPGPAPASC